MAPQSAAIQSFDGLGGLAGIAHFYKGKAAWQTGLSILDDIDVFNLTVGLEELPKLFLGRLDIQVPNEDTYQRHSLGLVRERAARFNPSAKSTAATPPGTHTDTPVRRNEA